MSLRSISFKILSSIPFVRKRGRVILMYHNVTKDRSPIFSNVTSEQFEDQIHTLLADGYIPVKVSEFVARMRVGEDISRHVAVSFDDGYDDLFPYMFPIIKKYNLPVSIFLITGYIGRPFPNKSGITQRILREEEIHIMIDSGLVEFLPHTRTHPRLENGAYPYEDEVESSYNDLERIVGVGVPKIFAYPRGQYTDAYVSWLKGHEWIASVTTEPGIVEEGADPFTIPRVMVYGDMSLSEFRVNLTKVGVLVRMCKHVLTVFRNI